MSLQAVAPPPRDIFSVSPRDGDVSIGPILGDDIGPLLLWLNDADAAVSDMPYRPVDCIAYNGWLEKQTELAQQILFIIRTGRPLRPVGFLIFKNLQPVSRSAELASASGPIATGDVVSEPRRSAWR